MAAAAGLGGTVDGGVYHRQALLDAGGGGPMARDLPLDVAAWALAGAWRGMEIYGLCGAAVVTGPNREDGGSQALESHLAQQVRAVSMLTPGRARLQVWGSGRASPVAAWHPAVVWSGAACTVLGDAENADGRGTVDADERGRKGPAGRVPAGWLSARCCCGRQGVGRFMPIARVAWR
jgi:hypothetical protein